MSNYSKSATHTVAIIGASFAGLTCAHALLTKKQPKHNNENDDTTILLQVVILEEGSASPTAYITNQLVLSLQALEILTKKLDMQVNHPEERSALLNKLRRGILPTKTTIRYSTHVESIQRAGSSSSSESSSPCCSKLCLHTNFLQEGQHSRKEKLLCDTVIVANGVRSSFRQSTFPGVYVIGDARWVADVWYHFGTSRLARGASTAIEDGMELGDYIRRSILRDDDDDSERNKREATNTIMVESKYLSTRIRRRTRIRQFVVAIIFMFSIYTSVGDLRQRALLLCIMATFVSLLRFLLRMRVNRR
jgi:hypothetical protein